MFHHHGRSKKAAGAWHDEGYGYVPKAGDGVVVLGDNHIVISDGKRRIYWR